MREFIDDGELRLARDDRVDVHILEGHAAVRNLAKRDKFEVADAGGGFGPAVRLDETKHDVVSLLTQLMSFFEHAVGDEARGARRDDPGAKLQSLPHQGEAPDFEQRGASQKSQYSNQCDCSSSINSFQADVMGRAEIVQRQVELEHVDAGLAQNAGPSRARMLADQGTDGIL